MKLDKVIGKKMTEFWSALWSCTIGTVIGIVLSLVRRPIWNMQLKRIQNIRPH